MLINPETPLHPKISSARSVTNKQHYLVDIAHEVRRLFIKRFANSGITVSFDNNIAEMLFANLRCSGTTKTAFYATTHQGRSHMSRLSYLEAILNSIGSTPIEIGRYVIVGLSVGIAFLAIFFLALQFGMKEWMASLLAYGMTVPVSFICQGRITFKKPLSKFSFFRFIMVATILAVFSELTSSILPEMVSTFGYIVICWGLISISNYFLYKVYVFR